MNRLEAILTQELVRELLDYDPETGVFKWRKSVPRRKAEHIAGTTNSRGYVIISINAKKYKAARLAWFYTHGFWPETIDHINHIRSDDRISNLREVDANEQQKNAALQARCKHGIHGVRRKDGGWAAFIGDNGKDTYLGCSLSLFEACCLRKSAENRLGYHPNHGRA